MPIFTPPKFLMNVSVSHLPFKVKRSGGDGTRKEVRFLMCRITHSKTAYFSDDEQN